MDPVALSPPLICSEPSSGIRTEAVLTRLDLWWATWAATLIPVSLLWDFSWESTIGVDRFWSPPHLATHVGIWLGGFLGLRLVWTYTRARLQGGAAAGITLGPFAGPVGAWVLLWSALELQAAFLLDSWWQQTYGLGAGLWHPPQILKAIGFFGLIFGAATLCTGARLRCVARMPGRTFLVSWCWGLFLGLCVLVLTMTNYPNWQHTAWFYLISCAIYPAILLTAAGTESATYGATQWVSDGGAREPNEVGRVTPCAPIRTKRSRRARSDPPPLAGYEATGTALAYMGLACAMVWVLPLFPAHPLTPPIHNPMDHMMPPPFPLLLVLPALALDFSRKRLKRLGDLWLAFAAGLAFFAVFLAAQWLFAEFLLSPGADNWFFAGGGRHWPFFLRIDKARVLFWGVKQDPLTWTTGLAALTLAAVSSWAGLRTGKLLGRLRR